MDRESQILIVLGILVILVAVFYPRDKPFFTAGVSAHIGNLGGKVQLETLENFSDMDKENKTMVLFYSPGCPWCKRMMPEWHKMEKMNKRKDVKIVKINCDENPEVARTFGIQGFPTIYFLPYGLNNPKARVEYDGERRGEAFLAFINKNV